MEQDFAKFSRIKRAFFKIKKAHFFKKLGKLIYFSCEPPNTVLVSSMSDKDNLLQIKLTWIRNIPIHCEIISIHVRLFVLQSIYLLNYS